jgi:hypothetical protein
MVAYPSRRAAGGSVPRASIAARRRSIARVFAARVRGVSAWRVLAASIWAPAAATAMDADLLRLGWLEGGLAG